eukprot:975172-Rhodomonas_salina.5
MLICPCSAGWHVHVLSYMSMCPGSEARMPICPLCVSAYPGSNACMSACLPGTNEARGGIAG